MCNNCNGHWPGLLFLFCGCRNSCNCNQNGRAGGCGSNQCGNNNCGCNSNSGRGCNGCGGYDAYYAAQYALNGSGGCGCGNSFNPYGVAGAAVANFGQTSPCGCGCNQGCNSYVGF